MKYEAIIFDMDGTITNSERLWDLATDTFLKANGICFSPQEKEILYKDLAGYSMADAMHVFKNRYDFVKSHEELIQEYTHHALSLFEKGLGFIEGFLDFHAKLANFNLKYGIATNADLKTLAATKRALSLETLFGTHIYSIHDVHHQAKPLPDIYLHAAQKLNCSPYACIAIEDTACGIQAAKAANMFCIGINSHGTPGLLADADMIIDGYHEIDLPTLLHS